MKFALLGDTILDEYYYGEVRRISPEAPIPVFKELYKKTKDGGAKNVYNNLTSLGNEVRFFTDDKNISVKKRFVCNNYTMFRTDVEEYVPFYDIDSIKIDDDIKFVLLSDYNKGFLHRANEIIDRLYDKTIIIDPKGSLKNYMNSTVVKLNEKEFHLYSEYDKPSEACIKYNIKYIIITRAEKAVSVIDQHGLLDEFYPEKYETKDVTGAGDVFLASLAHYMAKKDSIETAARKAMKLASLSVTKQGTYVLSHGDIMTVENNIVVFTNGCFDILHKGHVEYLQQSRMLGNKLIVGLNSDSSVKRLKGDKRPIMTENDRKFVLENLSCVDEVIIFDEDTPYGLIKKIRPDIITKGGDYANKEDVIGHDLAKVIILPYKEGYSTTNVMEKINDTQKN